MSDNKVTLDQLDNSAVEAMSSSVGDVNMLNTENKTIVGAITEIVGKKEIANAIGEPLAETDKFTEMSSEINGLLSTFKTNMMNAGVVVESGDKFKALIDKIKGLTEGEGNKGIQYAEGVADSINYDNFYRYENNSATHRMGFIEISTPFEPALIYAYTEYNYVANGGSSYTSYTSDVIFDNIKNDYTSAFIYAYTDSIVLYRVLNDYNNGICRLPVSYAVSTENTTPITTCHWYAIGVGEEDTTLRDSLASILEEEGVEVTEEDSMASLIVKTDEEFEDTRSTLANIMIEGGYNITGNESTDTLLDLLELNGIKSNVVKQVACGYSHTSILKNDGTIWSCGYNDTGQLGIGSTNAQVNEYLTQAVDIDNVKKIYCGHKNTFALKNDGTIWACGENSNGQLGLGDVKDRNVFTQVPIDNIKELYCGGMQTFVLKNDGTLWSCGYNGKNQLGLGEEEVTEYYSSFVQITTNISDVKKVVCGKNSSDFGSNFILKNDGTLWSCGYNQHGELALGEDSSIKATVFTQVTINGENIKDIFCGYGNIYALKEDGSLWSCGYNNSGQLGLGDTTTRRVLTQITTNINNDVKQVYCGHYHTFIIKNDGSLWVAGSGESGKLGLGSQTAQKVFTQVSSNKDIVDISAGTAHTIVLKKDGTVWAVGSNDHGRLGLGENLVSSSSFTGTFKHVTVNLNYF